MKYLKDISEEKKYSSINKYYAIEDKALSAYIKMVKDGITAELIKDLKPLFSKFPDLDAIFWNMDTSSESGDGNILDFHIQMGGKMFYMEGDNRGDKENPIFKILDSEKFNMPMMAGSNRTSIRFGRDGSIKEVKTKY